MTKEPTTTAVMPQFSEFWKQCVAATVQATGMEQTTAYIAVKLNDVTSAYAAEVSPEAFGQWMKNGAPRKAWK